MFPIKINKSMKIQELLNESVTDIVARFYKEASTEADRFYNPEDVKYKEKNAKYYDEHFKEWFKDDIVPVFEKPSTKPQPEYRPKPVGSELQSPGYRGLQYALAAAGLPYNHSVQKYQPNAPLTPSAEMDACRNNGN
jgi:hypothetical protein